MVGPRPVSLICLCQTARGDEFPPGFFQNLQIGRVIDVSERVQMPLNDEVWLAEAFEFGAS